MLQYFSQKELERVTHPDGELDRPVESYYSPLLLLMLDDMRRRDSGIPILLTSGFRGPKYNASVGGSSSSSHVKGLAMDIACSDTQHRYYYIRAALAAGFTRIGIGKNFIHVDIDRSKPDNLIWLYK